MIRMKVNTTQLNKLTNDLKRMRTKLLNETNETMVDMSKSLNESYSNSIQKLVYDEYDPEKYQRTKHLQGNNGAKVESMQMIGDKKSFQFYIDENSTDPVDGETWKVKADKIEHGSTEMSVGFNRPFIGETQDKLVWEADRLVDALIKRYEKIISNLGR